MTARAALKTLIVLRQAAATPMKQCLWSRRLIVVRYPVPARQCRARWTIRPFDQRVARERASWTNPLGARWSTQSVDVLVPAEEVGPEALDSFWPHSIRGTMATSASSHPLRERFMRVAVISARHHPDVVGLTGRWGPRAGQHAMRAKVLGFALPTPGPTRQAGGPSRAAVAWFRSAQPMAHPSVAEKANGRCSALRDRL